LLNSHRACRPETYDVDEVALESSFKALQRQLHPDKHATAGDEARGYAEAHSARLNEAYTTLGDPAERARYFLKLSGRPIAVEETVDDPVLLLEVCDKSVDGLMCDLSIYTCTGVCDVRACVHGCSGAI
jgi:DnaJ-domain-containing protein 1